MKPRVMSISKVDGGLGGPEGLGLRRRGHKGAQGSYSRGLGNYIGSQGAVLEVVVKKVLLCK